jgi:hypothetical protein
MSVKELVEDLKALRKGRGLQVSVINSRVGPALRAATGTRDDDSPLDVRGKLSQSIRRWSEELPDDLRKAVLSAFALTEGSHLQYYKDRVHGVAEQLGRDERTARRRIDEGITRLAEVAMSGSRPLEARSIEPAAGWHTEELRVSLALDQPTPEAFEWRRIVVDQDVIEHVDLALTLTSPPGLTGPAQTDDLDIDIFHGGRLTARAMESTDRFGFQLKLPKPLRRDETHHIGLRFRVRPDRTMAPHYVCVPNYRCVDFDLRVRFDLAHAPQQVWRLVNAFQRDVDDPVPTGERIPMDGCGEIHTSFHLLTPGKAYGIRWTPPEPGTGEP